MFITLKLLSFSFKWGKMCEYRKFGLGSVAEKIK